MGWLWLFVWPEKWEGPCLGGEVPLVSGFVPLTWSGPTHLPKWPKRFQGLTEAESATRQLVRVDRGRAVLFILNLSQRLQPSARPAVTIWFDFLQVLVAVHRR